MSDNTLIIFIKSPDEGAVKTRLAQGIGKKKAAVLYRLFVEAILTRTKDKSFGRVIFYDPPDKREEIMNWIGDDTELHPQSGNGLGERLSNAFDFVFNRDARKAVVIGSDSPTIDANIIRQAFRELETREFVIGPSRDGGYYLLGMSSFRKEVFQGIEWSTDRVFKETVRVFESLGADFHILDKDIDVDRPEDLTPLKAKLARASRRNPIGLSRLSEILAQLKK